MELFAANINAGSFGIEDRQGFHDRIKGQLSQRASRRMPGRHQKDKPPQREHRRNGVTKQYACRRPEPVSPAGNPQIENAPKGNAATLRPTTDALFPIRFRGSLRELIRGNLPPIEAERAREASGACKAGSCTDILFGDRRDALSYFIRVPQCSSVVRIALEDQFRC